MNRLNQVKKKIDQYVIYILTQISDDDMKTKCFEELEVVIEEAMRPVRGVENQNAEEQEEEEEGEVVEEEVEEVVEEVVEEGEGEAAELNAETPDIQTV